MKNTQEWCFPVSYKYPPCSRCDFSNSRKHALHLHISACRHTHKHTHNLIIAPYHAGQRAQLPLKKFSTVWLQDPALQVSNTKPNFLKTNILFLWYCTIMHQKEL